jgi:hypothetical protein
VLGDLEDDLPARTGPLRWFEERDPLRRARAGAEVLGEEQASIVDRRVPDDKPLIDPDVGGADVLSSRPESGSHPAFGDASWPYRVRNARTA